MQDLLLVGPALQLSDFLDLCRAAKPESVLFHPETTALRIKAINAPAADQLEAQAQGKAVDCLRLPAELSIQNVRLIALDMDSTLIANECIDDMAAIAGCGPEMARLTREAMEGLWPFSKNLVERVRLLKGADAGIALQTSESIRFSPGAQRLMRFMQAHSVDRWIISRCFSQIARPAAAKLGMTGVICNELVIEDGCLTGEVVGPAGGRILDADGKRRALEVLSSAAKAELCETIAVGDGANDVQMIRAAGNGFAYHAKQAAAQAARLRINHAGLDAIAACYSEYWTDAQVLI